LPPSSSSPLGFPACGLILFFFFSAASSLFFLSFFPQAFILLTFHFLFSSLPLTEPVFFALGGTRTSFFPLIFFFQALCQVVFRSRPLLMGAFLFFFFFPEVFFIDLGFPFFFMGEILLSPFKIDPVFPFPLVGAVCLFSPL